MIKYHIRAVNIMQIGNIEKLLFRHSHVTGEANRQKDFSPKNRIHHHRPQMDFVVQHLEKSTLAYKKHDKFHLCPEV